MFRTSCHDDSLSPSRGYSNDSVQSGCAPPKFDDSYGSRSSTSTTASLTDGFAGLQLRGSKNKLPSDFGFLFEPATKVPKTADVDELNSDNLDKHTKLQGKARQSLGSKTKTAGPADQLRVCGPEFIQTLRGHLLGREVALICCGEAHEDAIDLTRPQGITDEQYCWLKVPATRATGGGFLGFDSSEALHTKYNVTLAKAKEWAARVLDDENEDGEEGASLVFEAKVGTDVGVARVFDNTTKASTKRHLPARTTIFQWSEQDTEAKEYNENRLAGQGISTAELDAMVARRKQARLAEGLELFDDWLLRQCAGANALGIDVILENDVPASELEMHVEPGVSPAPPAHAVLKAIEPDSDMDSDEAKDPDDGTGSFADYMVRRTRAHLAPGRIHCIDARDLGKPPDAAEHGVMQAMLSEPLPEDREDTEASQLELEDDDEKMTPGNKRIDSTGKAAFPSLPSWELYFGSVAGIIYYSPHVKVDFTPLFVKCLDSPSKLAEFFEKLYFGTVPAAVDTLGPLDEETRSLTRIRSLTQSSGGQCWRRAREDRLVPIRAAPVDRYLKARGSQPPRTWVSGLGQQVRAGGLGNVVDAAQAWVQSSMKELLGGRADPSGDYFSSWLREGHPEIYHDIDHSDAGKMRRAKSMPSFSHPGSKAHRHNLEDISIPNVEETFAELRKLNLQAGNCSTRRQRILAKILVDAYQLRLVDLAAILKIAHIVTQAPEGSRCAIVIYAGSDHVKSVVSFWEQNGLSHAGLCRKGMAGKKNWKDGESKGVTMPPYLHDLNRLFPVPSTTNQS